MPLYQKILIWLGIIAIFGFLVFIVYKQMPDKRTIYWCAAEQT